MDSRSGVGRGDDLEEWGKPFDTNVSLLVFGRAGGNQHMLEMTPENTKLYIKPLSTICYCLIQQGVGGYGPTLISMERLQCELYILGTFPYYGIKRRRP